MDAPVKKKALSRPSLSPQKKDKCIVFPLVRLVLWCTSFMHLSLDFNSLLFFSLFTILFMEVFICFLLLL